MTFLVIAPFVDLEDGHHMYRVGDVYPRAGLNVSEERIMQLLSTQNKAHKSFLERVAEQTNEESSAVETETVETVEQPKKRRTKRSK
jgi:gas vesicle protein